MIGQMKARGRPIGAERLDKLREGYLAGATIAAAAAAAACSPSTAFNKFRGFKLQGLVRGRRPRRAGARPYVAPADLNRKYPASWELPRYTGPAWIGKRIDRESLI